MAKCKAGALKGTRVLKGMASLENWQDRNKGSSGEEGRLTRQGRDESRNREKPNQRGLWMSRYDIRVYA